MIQLVWFKPYSTLGCKKLSMDKQSNFYTCKKVLNIDYVGHIFSRVRHFYERAVSNLDPQRSMHRPV
jgi:hypothetical protein